MRRRPPGVPPTAADLLAGLAWLLRKEPGGMKAIAGLIESGLVKLVELDDAALPRIIAFLERYASAGAQLADAALLYIAEQEGIDTVFTLDRRDFSIYRTTDGRALEIVPQP